MSYDFLREARLIGDVEPTLADSYFTTPGKRATSPQRTFAKPSNKRLVLVKPRKAAANWISEQEQENTDAIAQELADSIKAKYGHLGDLQKIVYSAEYMSVIGLGPKVVRFLLRDMNGAVPWFWALQAITRENVGVDVGAGNFRALSDAWLSWGRGKGLI